MLRRAVLAVVSRTHADDKTPSKTVLHFLRGTLSPRGTSSISFCTQEKKKNTLINNIKRILRSSRRTSRTQSSLSSVSRHGVKINPIQYTNIKPFSRLFRGVFKNRDHPEMEIYLPFTQWWASGQSVPSLEIVFVWLTGEVFRWDAGPSCHNVPWWTHLQ